MNFYISTEKHSKLPICTKFKNLYIYYDNTVEVEQTSNCITLFSGILWSGSLDTIPNGQFYSIKIYENTVEVITDFISDFCVYYLKKDDLFILTNSILDISSSVNVTYLHSWLHNPLIDNNTTILNDVFTVNRFTKHYFSLSGDTIKETTYLKPTYFTDSFIPTHTFDEAKHIVKNILTENLSKFPKNTTFLCSSGIDSILLHQLNPNFKLISYQGDWWEREKIKQISSNHKIYTFSKKEYLDACKSIEKCVNIPSKHYSLKIETYILSQQTDNIILNGSYGDEIFWHEPVCAMANYYWQQGNKSYTEYLNFIDAYYTNQPYQTTQHTYYKIKDSSCIEDCLSDRLLLRYSYLKDLRPLSNKLVLSPYIDLRLRTLLPKCDIETQQRSSYDAELQFALLDNKDKVNRFKMGGEEGHDLFNDKMSLSWRDMMKHFLKNYRNYHDTL